MCDQRKYTCYIHISSRRENHIMSEKNDCKMSLEGSYQRGLGMLASQWSDCCRYIHNNVTNIPLVCGMNRFVRDIYTKSLKITKFVPTSLLPVIPQGYIHNRVINIPDSCALSELQLLKSTMSSSVVYITNRPYSSSFPIQQYWQNLLLVRSPLTMQYIVIYIK